MDYHDFIGMKGNLFEHRVASWLYGEYSEEKLGQFEFFYHIPHVRDYMDYLLDRRADKEYLDRYGMDYSDVHDPRKLRETSSGSRVYGSVLNFVSSNVGKLYK